MDLKYYELGVKLATSKWREMIRAGEIGAQSAKKLIKRMGYTAEREAAGLNKGSYNIAKQLGVPIHTSVPQGHPYADALEEGLRYGKGMVFPRTGIVVNPAAHATKADLALTLRHEVDEVREGLRAGVHPMTSRTPRVVQTPHKVDETLETNYKELSESSAQRDYQWDLWRAIQARTKLRLRAKFPEHAMFYSHQSPEVITRQMRNTRMIPAEVPRLTKDMAPAEYKTMSDLMKDGPRPVVNHLPPYTKEAPKATRASKAFANTILPRRGRSVPARLWEDQLRLSQQTADNFVANARKRLRALRRTRGAQGNATGTPTQPDAISPTREM